MKDSDCLSEEDKKILDYMNMPVETKLRWLEEINQFLYLAMDDKAKKASEYLRNLKR